MKSDNVKPAKPEVHFSKDFTDSSFRGTRKDIFLIPCEEASIVSQRSEKMLCSHLPFLSKELKRNLIVHPKFFGVEIHFYQ
jgi:hypothetical protein